MDLRIDIVVLGATGFTGRYAVKNLAVLSKQPEYRDIRWGIAGRSREKLQNLLSELEELDVEINKVPVLEFDIEKEDSLQEVTKKTKLIMNATGPNTLLSEPIVKACIQNRTHYLDISAELYHMLNIYRTYHEAAENANVLIIPGCGFDCIPTMAGLIYLKENFKGTLQTVESYNILDIPKKAYFPSCNTTILHYGTWESMIHEMFNFKKYRELKKLTFPESEPVPQEIQKSFFHRYKGRFWCPYPGPDCDVVEMFQRYQKDHGKTPYYFKNYITMPLFIHFFIIVPAFFCFYLMSHFSWLRKLLWKYPRVFTLGYVSHKGPNEKMRKELKYSLTMTGKGWSYGIDGKSTTDRTLTIKVSGNDPAYKTTGISFVCSAFTVIKERSKIPSGGVITSGAAFSNTTLVEKLQKHGMEFEILDDNNKLKTNETIVENGGVITSGAAFSDTTLVEKLQKHGMEFEILDDNDKLKTSKAIVEKL